ncbi:MAG: hypothetical protein JXX29_17815 [Deltaproteobacteria bacterium]|nr:hypothetical protein [Deltaproteobacteria bacterium]MBN2673543.1 hypothetical protein [Deltaproteobacteria bacterium]
MKTAYDFFQTYLAENIADSDVLQRMQNVIAEFSARAPKMIVMKCIDGRVHGSAAKGYPPTTVVFGRTDGNKVSLDRSNFWYWNRIDRVVKNAYFNTPQTPAVFIAFMHHSKSGLGCASHQSNDVEAYKSIEMQMTEVRKQYSDAELFVLGGDTETDTMAEALIFSDGTRLDSAEIISYCNLVKPADVFHKAFVSQKIDDIATCRNINHQTPLALLEGENPRFFANLDVCLNMQNYLLRTITTLIRKERTELYRIVRPDVLDLIFDTIREQKIPVNLLGPIVYQTVWNIAYSLYHTTLLKSLSEEQRTALLDHAEELACYGDGFETLPRNKSVLVKTGRGNDMEALHVARKVLEKNRVRYHQDHKLLVHINVEVNGQMMEWEDFNDNVGSRILTMLRNVGSVFGDDVAILTSYSYRNEKRFYPVKISREDSRLVYPVDVIAPVNSISKFSNMLLKAEEALYRMEFFKESR